MTLDPRTPVLVGVGQAQHHPRSAEDIGAPVDLAVQALRRAGQDSCTGDALLRRAGSWRAVQSLSWRHGDPAAVLAGAFGAQPRERVRSTVGGDAPQALVDDAALAMLRGELDVAVVVGVETVRSAMLARAAGLEPEWNAKGRAGTPTRTLGEDRPGNSPAEIAVGLSLPTNVYPLFEVALRARSGASPGEHIAAVAALMARFTDVAAGNPYAWSPTPRTAEDLATVRPDNRMVTAPYPKYLTANIMVDQAAALILCTAEAAAAAGVPRHRWVFPRSAARARDHWFVTSRPDLAASPAARLAGRRALDLAAAGGDDIRYIDLYSCFPSAVQVVASELGLPLDDASRPLTVTGGLPYAGGPGNNYVSHSIATMAELLRGDPGTLGLVTSIGWYITKNAASVWSTEPPATPFRAESAQDEVDRTPSVEMAETAEGSATIESYAVPHDRDGAPENAIVVARLVDGRRALATTVEPDALRALLSAEQVGATVRLDAAGGAELA